MDSAIANLKSLGVRLKNHVGECQDQQMDVEEEEEEDAYIQKWSFFVLFSFRLLGHKQM